MAGASKNDLVLDSLNVVLRQCHTLLCTQERQQYLNPLARLHPSKDHQMPGERAAQQPHPVARSQLEPRQLDQTVALSLTQVIDV